MKSLGVVTAVALTIFSTNSFAADASVSLVTIRGNEETGTIFTGEVILGDNKTGQTYRCVFSINPGNGSSATHECRQGVSASAGNYTYLGRPGQKVGEKSANSYFASFEAGSRTVRFCMETAFIGGGRDPRQLCTEATLPK